MFIPTIGLEIHLQLKTKSKMFCACSQQGESLPNSNVCPICLGYPGTLPTVNEQAVKKTIKLAVALNCQINPISQFSRKNYFYPDLPKGYQISQYDQPLASHGYLQLIDHKIHITRIHLEEDTAKIIHLKQQPYSLVDYNRAGISLAELVTEPDFHSAKLAKRFCRELQLICRYLDISDANMEKGEMRCEVNISLSQTKKKLGTKVEIKNLNSFQAVERSIEYEIKRQNILLKKKKIIQQETRGWSADKQITYSQRIKEEAQDYRYFPEPDLLLLDIEKLAGLSVEKIKNNLTELPMAKRQRFQQEYGFSASEANIIITNERLADYTEKIISELRAWLISENSGGNEQDIWQKNKKKLTKLVSNWLINRLLGLLKQHKTLLPDLKITPENFAQFIVILSQRHFSSSLGRQILEQMFISGQDPEQIINEQNIQQVDDQSSLEEIVQQIIDANPILIEQYRQGKTVIIKFLVGQAMKQTKGRANPQLIEQSLIRLLTNK